MSRTVLFAGGPLHGTTMTVDDDAYTVCALEPAEVPLDPFALDVMPPVPRQVAYKLSRLAMCGRVIWIGHLGAAPDEDLAFEVLTSDGAKQASVLALPA
jgi:hypothetical protein